MAKNSITAGDRRRAWGPNNYLNRFNYGSTSQTIAITDLISEGPIEGLVRGGKSIFLNNDPIFEDEETSYSSSTGETLTGTANNATLTINDFGGRAFTYDPEEEGASRLLYIHYMYDLTYEDNSSLPSSTDFTSDGHKLTFQSFDVNELAIGLGFLRGGFINVRFYLNPGETTNPIPTPYIVTSDQTLHNKALGAGDAMVTLSSADGDRHIVGILQGLTLITPDNPDTEDSSAAYVNLQMYVSFQQLLDNGLDWIEDSNTSLRLRVTTVHDVEKIVAGTQQASTITLKSTVTDNLPFKNFDRRAFTLTAPTYENDTSTSADRKYNNSSFQFKPGSVDQNAIQTIGGDVGSSSVSLTAHPQMGIGETKKIISVGAQAAEIDKIHLVFTYPSGIYGQNTENSDKFSAYAGYAIEIQVQQATDQTLDSSWKSLGWFEGNTLLTQRAIDDLSLGTHGSDNQNMGVGYGNEKGPVSNITAKNIISGAQTAGNGDRLTHAFAHGGKFTSGASFTHTLDLEKYKPFQGFRLLVTRITESENINDESTSRTHNRNLDWNMWDFNKSQAIQAGGISQSIGVITERLNFPYSAIANVSFNAKQFSDTPGRAYECMGLKVQVPHNYQTREQFGMVTEAIANPAGQTPGSGLIGKERVNSFPSHERLYTGLFTGQFKTAKVYTDNPAWVFYDLLTNNRYGVGDFIREGLDGDIDIFSLYKIAKYCDELVPDGKGGVEPRFRANIYLQKAADVFKVAKDFATVFRGMLYYMDGKITPVIDEKKSPVYTFNRSNVKEGIFAYEHTGSKTRTNQVIVSWNNPDAEYKLEPLFVEDRENIINTGQIVKEECTAFGCTSEGQAIRFGRWKLWTAINQTEIATFTTSINAAFLAPGDIINIQDNHDFGLKYGGRLKSHNSTAGNQVFELDRSVDGNASSTGAKLAFLLSKEEFINLETYAPVTTWKVEVPDDIDATFDGYTTTSATVSIVANTLARNAISSPNAKDFAYQTDVDKLYQYSGSAWVATDQLSSSDPSYNLIIDALVDDALSATSPHAPLNLERLGSTSIREVAMQANYISSDGITLTIPSSVLSDTDAVAAFSGNIWALQDNVESTASYKQYKIVSIAQEERHEYSIVAVEYYETKFDILETNFSTAIPDPLDPPEPQDSKVPPPKGLRVLRSPDFSKSGQEITLAWDSPAGAFSFNAANNSTNPTFDRLRNTVETTLSGMVNVVGYNVETDLPNHSDVEYLDGSTSRFYDSVKDGEYTFKVTSVSRQGRLSRPAILTTRIYDYYGGNHLRHKGILKGGKTSIAEAVDNASKIIKFGKNPVFLLSPGDATNTSVSFDFGTGLDYSVITDNVSESWHTAENLCFNNAFVLLSDYGRNSRTLRLVNYVNNDPKLNVSYWYDQRDQTAKLFNANKGTTAAGYSTVVGGTDPVNGTPDIWKTLSGGVIIENGSSKVIGIGTNFTTEFSPIGEGAGSGAETNVIKFEENQAAHIGYIESDTVMFLDRAFNFKEFTVTGAQNVGGTKVKYTTQVDHTFVVGDYVSVGGINMTGGTGDPNTSVSPYFAKEKIIEVTDRTFTLEKVATGALLTTSAARATTAIGGSHPQASGQVVNRYYKNKLILDYRKDILIGKLTPFGPTLYDTFLVPDAGIDRGRTITIDATVAALSYSGDTDPPTLDTDVTGGINLTVDSLNFDEPEFQVRGLGFNQLPTVEDGVNVFSAPTSGGSFTKVLLAASSSATVAFGSDATAGPLSFTVKVREKNNVALFVEKTFDIIKVKDGASGSQGRTVSLESLDDTTILYDKGKENPNFTDTNGDGDLDFQAVAFNFGTNPLFRFTQDGTAGNWGTVSTKSITVPQNFSSSMTKNLKVEVAEQPTNWNTSAQTPTPEVAASDTVRINKFFEGQDVLEIDMPNSTVGVDTDFQGNFSDITVPGDIPGTGVTMEVINNGTVATYVGVTSGAQVGKANASTALAANEWYIESVADSDANIEAGNITGVSSNIVSIGPARLINSQTTSGSNERITWTIRIKRNASDPEVTKTISQTLFKTKAGKNSSHRVEIFARNTDSTTAPALPTGTIDFSTDVPSYSFTQNTASWSTTPSGVNSANPFEWSCFAIKAPPVSGDTTSVATSDWSTPVVINSHVQNVPIATGTNLNHTFIGNSAGIVTNNNYSCGFNVTKAGQDYTFAASGTTENTFGISIVTNPAAVGCVPTIGSTGLVSIDGTSDILDTASVTNASFRVQIFDRGDANTVINEYAISLIKINQALRDGAVFSLTGQSTAVASNWASNSLSTDTARTAADHIIANSADLHISPNDSITVSDQAGNAGTRIYTGSRTNNRANVSNASWSSLVTQSIPGSAIVQGTLSAAALTSNTTTSNQLNVGDRLQIGTSSSPSSGVLNSVDKTTFSDNSPGFFMDGSGNVCIGNATNYFKFNASTGSFDLAGNVTIQGPTGPAGATGATGSAGAPGGQGDKGDPGDQGDKGDPGDTGSQGPAGPQGLAGVNGVDGAVGPAGAAGAQGLQGPAGTTGTNGQAGSAFFTVNRNSANSEPTSVTDNELNAAIGRTTPIAGDVAIVTWFQGDRSVALRYNGSSWVDAALFITGDVIVDGSVTASEIAAGAVIASKINANQINANHLVISNDTSQSTNQGIYFDATGVITIRDSGGALRVKLGKLN